MDKTNTRRLQIVEILSEEDKWFKLDDLAINLNCTEKTIRSDIQYLNSIFPLGWSIETVKGKGIYVHKPTNSSIEDIQTIFINEAFSYKVIVFILFNNISVLSDLSKEMYVQYNTIYKILDRVEVILSTYNLNLSRNPLQINGKEKYKKILLNTVMLDLYFQKNEWPFKEYSYNHLYELVSKTTEKYELILNPSVTKKYLICIGVILNRLNFDTVLDFDSTVLEKVKNTIFYPIATDICNNIENEFNVIIPYDDRIFLTIYFSNLTTENLDDLEVKDIHKLLMNKANKFYEELFELILQLEKYTRINLFENKEFIYSAYKQFKANSLLKFIPLLIHPYSPLADYTKSNFPILFKNTQLALKNWTDKNSYPEVTDNIVARVTITIQAGINLTSLDKRVLLLNSESEAIRFYNFSKLKKEFGNKITFVEMGKRGYSQNSLEEAKIDFIISDYKLEDIENIPLIKISSKLTQRDIKVISKYLS